jgi:hypothetical protein
MAAGDSFSGAPSAAAGAVLVDRIDGVLAAGGIEAAMSTDETSQGHSIKQNELDEYPAHGG